MKFTPVLPMLALLTLPALAQTVRPLRYEAEAGVIAASTAQTPFWLRTNQYGIVPPTGPVATVRAGVTREYRPADSVAVRRARLDWGFGVQGVVNAGRVNQGLLPEAYAKVRYRGVEFYAGRRREVMGVGDTTLTSGFLIWSGNAMPVPKVQLHTPDFVSIGFLKHLLAFKVSYAHAWFNTPYIQGAYLHQKHVYLRLGKPRWKLRAYAGLNHQVQWGGRADYLIGSPFAVNGKLTTAFQDYRDLVLGKIPDDYENDRFTNFDGYNRIGNHLGQYDAALEWNTPARNILFYHQHPFEDASGLVLANFGDGLTGLRLQNRRRTDGRAFQLRGVVLERLNTTNQSGPTFDLDGTQYKGSDDYFNHRQYREGWSYIGRTLGTPFIPPRPELRPEVQQRSGDVFFPDCRVTVWYLGAEGLLHERITLTARVSVGKHYGMYSRTYNPPIDQFSALLSARMPLRRWPNTVLSASLAADQGQLYPASTGGFVSIRKVW